MKYRPIHSWRQRCGVALLTAFTAFGLTLASATSAAATCGGGGKRDYFFSGKLAVQNDGTTQELEGVQIRIVRANSPLKWAQGPDAVTDSNGHFRVKCQFARDKNGATLPGGDKINFKIMARFRDDALKIRKGGWAKNNWFKVADRKGCHRSKKAFAPACKDYRFDNVDKTFDTANLAGKHAVLWQAYRTLDDRLAQHNVGLEDRPLFRRQLVVTYPDKNVRNFFAKLKKKHLGQGQGATAFFLFNIHLAADHFDKSPANATRIMVHEYMHRWDIGHEQGRGGSHITCLLDKHHRSPNTKLISRCGGYMEGFAEATAQRLTKVIPEFPAYYIQPHTRWEMRNKADGKDSDPHAPKYRLTSLSDAQRTDAGWENFLKLFWTSNEWRHSGGDPAYAKTCDPKDVSVYRMLQAIAAQAPKKGNWYKLKGNATFEWFTEAMQREIAGFGPKDAKLYQLMGDPSLRGKEIFNRVCKPGSGNIHTVVIDGSAKSGGTDYTVSGGGRLTQVSGQIDGFNATIQSNDKVSGNTARGRVVAGIDGFKVQGKKVPTVSLKDHSAAKVYIDGQLVRAGGSNTHTVVIDGSAKSGGTDYTVSGGGRLTQVSGQIDGFNATIQSNDKVSGKTARGRVVAGIDGFKVQGKVPTVSLKNPGAAVVYIDGVKKAN